MPKAPKNTTRHPGGRPPKLDKHEWGQVTCVMRNDTIARLRDGAGSKHFGFFLQDHLDRYPPPTREQYEALNNNREYWSTIKHRKVPVIMAAGSLSREARKLARERTRREQLTPAQRAREDEIRDRIQKIAVA